MNSIIEKELNIEDMIYEIRGKQVILDSDLAKLYKCKNGTKTINLAVKRHINRFPQRFMFQLTREEYIKVLRFQSETLELEQGKYNKYLPYAFTEQGVAMLATILRTSVAEEVSIQIMDAFVAMRKYVSSNLIEQKFINNMVLEHENAIKLLQVSFDKLEEKKKVNEIFFKGQIFDSYFKIMEIFNSSKKELIIIDRYVDISILDMIKKINAKIIIITSKNRLTILDIDKYNKQYHNLRVIYNDSFHDRYFIIDRNIIYHCGTSINHAGSKTFSINILEDEFVKVSLINNILKII